MNLPLPIARRAMPVLPTLFVCLTVELDAIPEEEPLAVKVVFKKPPLIISALESGSKARAFMVNEQ